MPRLLTFCLLTLAWTVAAIAASPVRCQTHYEAAIHRWQTVCQDGTRSTSTYSPALRQWQTTVTPLGKTCTGQMHPSTRQVEVRCR